MATQERRVRQARRDTSERWANLDNPVLAALEEGLEIRDPLLPPEKMVLMDRKASPAASALWAPPASPDDLDLPVSEVRRARRASMEKREQRARRATGVATEKTENRDSPE